MPPADATALRQATRSPYHTYRLLISINDVFQDMLRNLGWVEGRNITIDF